MKHYFTLRSNDHYLTLQSNNHYFILRSNDHFKLILFILNFEFSCANTKCEMIAVSGFTPLAEQELFQQLNGNSIIAVSLMLQVENHFNNG